MGRSIRKRSISRSGLWFVALVSIAKQNTNIGSILSRSRIVVGWVSQAKLNRRQVQSISR